MPTAQLARSERTGLCDLLNELGPEAATLCDGWLTKDLAAHLFVRERRPLAMPGLLVGGALAKLTDVSMESALRSHGYDALVAKVRSGPPLLARRLDEIVNLECSPARSGAPGSSSSGPTASGSSLDGPSHARC